VPVEMCTAQAVAMGKKVYVRGGTIEKCEDVFQYNTSNGEWSHLPPHPVYRSSLAQFTGHLITVGGWIPGSIPSSKVYHFKEESQEWEEFLKPMLTARFVLSVATTQSAIVASGGVTDVGDGKPVVCAAVEVYSSETSQWYTADPLPAPYHGMTSVTIANTCYLLGGWDVDSKAATTVLYASLTSLVQKAASPTHQSASHTSVWKTLPDTPLKLSAAATLSGHLLAVGGYNVITSILPVVPAVHVFLPLTNSWVRVTDGDLPQPRYECTAVQLSSNTMIVIGGKDNQEITKTVFRGTITV